MSATKWPMPQAQGEAQDAAEAHYAKRSGADWQDAPETRGQGSEASCAGRGAMEQMKV